MHASGKHCIRASRSSLETLSRLVDSECAGMPADDRLRLVLVLEELLCNSIDHGYGGDSEQSIWLLLLPAADGCRVVFEDAAGEYDPFSDGDELDLAARLTGHHVGGLGVHLVMQLSGWRHYARLEQRNVIELFLPQRGPARPGT